MKRGINIKRILLIGTGGTIASSKGQEGLTPIYSTEYLLRFIPETFKICDIDTLQLVNIDSTNIQPKHWMQIADTINEKYFIYDGFVVTHGTDTMSYTAAVLSYMLQNNEKPIVVTGSQKPMEAEKTDARLNLMDSIRFACENIGGTYIVFNGKVINGCRAVKLRTKSCNAFESINLPFAASIDMAEIKYNPNYLFPKKHGEFKYFASVSEDVFLLKLVPGVSPDILDYINGKYKGVVVESFGSGGIPFLGDGNILAKVENLAASGVIVVITTQCLYEGGDLDLYEVGQKVMKNKVIPAYDMTTEAAVTKLMWILGQENDFDTVKSMFLKPVNNDIAFNSLF